MCLYSDMIFYYYYIHLFDNFILFLVAFIGLKRLDLADYKLNHRNFNIIYQIQGFIIKNYNFLFCLDFLFINFIFYLTFQQLFIF